MRCEVCGRKIHTDPVRAVIEGAKLTVCVECSKHGKVVVYEETAVSSSSPTKSYAHIPSIMRKPSVAQVQITTEVVDDYASKIRLAREKLGLSHEDLGKKINEKTSVLRHIETGKVAPNNQLANKLEHALKITLMIPIADEKVTDAVPKKGGEGLTFGDLIDMNKPRGEVSRRRKLS
ncbi:MAG: multiprotein bridging factor aMBF1 [Nitrososphaerota archaeon]|jgi:putative transcription factor|nr:multiprotein bridging factor aMBF1 [Nitrososphaerota archaeon]